MKLFSNIFWISITLSLVFVFFFFQKLLIGCMVYTQIHLTRHFSPAQCACWLCEPHHMAQERVCAHHTIFIVIHDERLIDRLSSLFSSLRSFPCVSPTPCSSLPTSTCTLSWTSSSMWTTPRQINHCASANRGVLHPGRIHSSHRLSAQRPWRLPLLGDYRNHLPGGIRRQRYGALVLVWRGTRRWDHRESALFTTIHLGARRTSGP